ncbi:hypothetical protein [Cellvibrio mixtus]|uniref:hypothetical protein n=1 Tax=Cellvibrio mixtus TaxID=39650 RepID=UPI0005864B9F|nr:hypothetical protein [Cellvibrio mixtus]
MASSSKKLKNVGVDVGTIGTVGAIMLAVINKTCEGEWYQEPLVLSVPVVSALISNGLKWLWDVVSLENAEVIKLRRCLKKQIVAIKADLKSPNFSDEYKLQRKIQLEKLSAELINSHQYIAPDKN